VHEIDCNQIDWHTRDEARGSQGPNIETSGEATEFEQPLYAAKLLTRSDLRALPKPEPLIGNVLDQGTTALLYGTWGTAKTFIALDWAASVATGRDWQA
jgi:AAA domain